MTQNRWFMFLFFIFIATHIASLYPGFAAGTLVKIPGGYTPIENLQVGDFVYSITPQRTYKLSKVTHTTNYALPKSIKIITANDIIIAAPKQKFYLPHAQKWISAKKISFKDHLGTGNAACTQEFTTVHLDRVTDFFDIRIDDIHTFCVSTDDIIVHNFPLFFIGFTIAWGGGQIALDGIYAGICIAGWWLGTTLLKGKNSSGSNNFKMNPFISYGSPDPDDDEWKKKHPHGRYVESPKHNQNSRGRIGKPPRDGQAALDNSFEVHGKRYRIAVQDGNVVQLMRTAINEYHGFIVEETRLLRDAAKTALRNNGFNINQKTGKLKL